MNTTRTGKILPANLTNHTNGEEEKVFFVPFVRFVGNQSCPGAGRQCRGRGGPRLVRLCEARVRPSPTKSDQKNMCMTRNGKIGRLPKASGNRSTAGWSVAISERRLPVGFGHPYNQHVGYESNHGTT